MSPTSKPVLALTPGEPAGIGPDLCLLLASQPIDATLVVIADPELINERQALLGTSIQINLLPSTLQREAIPATRPGELNLLPVKLAATANPGQLDPANAAYVLETLRKAVQLCQEGICDALVTGPVHKGVINDAGIDFSGHTEFLAGLVNADPVMMLACPGLRVALATTHLPLRDVSDNITRTGLETNLRIIHHDLQQRFGIEQPNIFVCGLNPHAGEGGHLGREEIEVIGPALEQLRSEGLNLVGPLSADTLFTPRYLEQADLVLAMFHDQGLPVLKHMGFGQAVNVTLGLPIIRTSVDHGTALELAGSGQADTGSLEYAIDVACQMVHAQPAQQSA